MLQCCDIFWYLVLSFLCLFEFVCCIQLTLEQMAGIFASECCSDCGGSRIPQLQQTFATSNSDWKASTGVFLSCTGNQPTNQPLSAQAGVCGYGETATHCHWPRTSLLPPLWKVEVQRELMG